MVAMTAVSCVLKVTLVLHLRILSAENDNVSG